MRGGFSLDGFVVHTLVRDLGAQCLSQLFRDGGIEALSEHCDCAEEQAAQRFLHT